MIERSFYFREGDLFVPTALTRGPWSSEHQHGGPPAALVGRAMERFGDAAAEFHVVRVTVELLRPVPIAPLRVEVRYLNDGRVAQRLEAVMSAGGTDVLRATGVRLRKRDLQVPAGVSDPAPAAAPPETLAPFSFPFIRHDDIGYHSAVDFRYARGTWGDRDVVVWGRPNVPLLDGEATSPLSRVLILADSEGGLCPPVSPDEFTFLNPDLTLYCERPLRGDWLGLAVRSSAHAIGTGLAESALFDADGVLGRSAQSLTVSRRAK